MTDRYILVMHQAFKLFNMHIPWKNVSCQVFLANLDVSRTFSKNY